MAKNVDMSEWYMFRNLFTLKVNYTQPPVHQSSILLSPLEELLYAHLLGEFYLLF